MRSLTSSSFALSFALSFGLSSGSAVGQQVARFDFETDQLHSPQPAFAAVSDLTLSNTHMFGGQPSDHWLCLTTDWNSTGGTVSFVVAPAWPYNVSYTHLRWQSATFDASLSDSVRAVTVTANGTPIGTVDPIPHSTQFDLDLTGVPSLQEQTGPVTFQFTFTGNPTGASAHEISHIELLGTPCDFSLVSVTPTTLPNVTGQYFTISGTGWADGTNTSLLTSLTFGGVPLSPYVPGSLGVGGYTLINGCTIDVYPPLCLPAGTYTIHVATACDSDSIDVVLTDPATPTLACEANHPVGQQQCFYFHAGGPGPQILFLVASNSDLPSSWPGHLELDIGNAFTQIILFATVSDCWQFCITPPPDRVGHCWHFQGFVWHSSNMDWMQPFPVSNACSTCWY